MKLGLLVCGHVSDQYLDIAGDYEHQFRALFSGHPEVELVVYDAVNGQLPHGPEECDAWITTGSRSSVNDDEQWIRDLEEFIRHVAKAEVPFVGICFGHQLLAKALGGSVVRSEKGWGVGIKEVQMPDGSFRVLNMHEDQVDHIPEGAEVLGWSSDCPVSVMAVGDKMLGIQGHPEMPVAYADAILNARRGNLIAEETAEEGLRSLSQDPDSVALADWIVGFVEVG